MSVTGLRLALGRPTDDPEPEPSEEGPLMKVEDSFSGARRLRGFENQRLKP